MLIGDLAADEYERFLKLPEFGGSDAVVRLRATCAGRSALVLEDEPVLAGRLVGALQNAGFARIVHVTTGYRALAAATRERFDVIVLDRLNPDIEGLEVARRLRGLLPASDNSAETPILIVTSLGAADERTKAFLAGARFNDYVSKADVNWEELLARVTAQIEQSNVRRGGRIAVGGLTIDPDARTIEFEGIALPLADRSFDIMLELMRHDGRPVTRQMLWQRCWNREPHEEMTNVVNVAISRIRKLISATMAENGMSAELQKSDAFVQNVWSRGLAVRHIGRAR